MLGWAQCDSSPDNCYICVKGYMRYEGWRGRAWEEGPKGENLTHLLEMLSQCNESHEFVNTLFPCVYDFRLHD